MTTDSLETPVILSSPFEIQRPVAHPLTAGFLELI